jgi:hypothetical protein
MQPLPAGNEFAAFIGIDWADAKHDICLRAANAARREFSHPPCQPAGLGMAVLEWRLMGDWYGPDT